METDSIEISTAQIHAQLDRIFSSAGFCDSPTLQRLLSFLVNESIAGRPDALKEYTIGTSVFQRGADFDPRTDSIVRVQMGALRKKLAAYYDKAGTLDEVVIDIPRGHYAPSIGLRPPQPVAPEPPAGLPRATGWRSRIAWSSGAFLLGIVCMWLLYASFGWSSQSSARAPKDLQWSDHPVWRGFFEPGKTTRLVVGVPFMYTIGGMMVRDPVINSVKDFDTSPRMRSLTGMLGHANPCEVYTGLGEAAGINLLTRFFASSSQDLTLIRSRLAKWQDLATGNAIFLSSARFRTLDTQIARPIDFEFIQHDLRMEIHNRQPKGERYFTGMHTGADGLDEGTDYALVSVWPGTAPGRRIVTMGGTYTWGTEGAAQYLTDGPSLNELKKKLSVGMPADSASHGLQIILKVEVKNNQVAETNYVTHHWLH